MNVNYSKELKHAFVADGCQLKKLTKLLQDSVGKVHIRVDCGDEFSLDFETINDLLHYENPPSKEIRRIRLMAESDDYSNSTTITLPGFSKQGVLIDLTGSESFVYTLREKTQDIVVGMSPWYDRLARISSVHPLYIMVATMLPVGWLAGSLVKRLGFDAENSLIVPLLIVIIVIIGLFTLMLLGSKLCRYLFPRAVFRIGQGKSRFERLQRVRKVILGVVGFVISAAGTAIGIWQAIGRK